MANIGILGGTFDPIHKGHLALGQQAYEQFKLDQIWFMPSSLPPHKRAQKVTEGTERQDMVSWLSGIIRGLSILILNSGVTETAILLRPLCY